MKKDIYVPGTTFTLLKNGEISVFSGIYLNKEASCIPVGIDSANIKKIDDCSFVKVEGVIPEKKTEQTMKKSDVKETEETDEKKLVSPYLPTVFFIDYSVNPTRPKLVMSSYQQASQIGLMRLTLVKDALKKHNGETYQMNACSSGRDTNEFLFAIRSGKKSRYDFMSGAYLELEYTGKAFNCAMNF